MMTTVGLNKLDLSKLKKAPTKDEALAKIGEFKKAEEALRKECERRGIQQPIILA